ncbi:MAG: 30S ribosomal protein S1, partial [Planctomycetota bacterium]|nr:30S ribosomal protein S1 [Planctomycetota bacterium]
MAIVSRRVRQYELDADDLERRLDSSLAGLTAEELDTALGEQIADPITGQIVSAKVDSIDERSGMVLMDIGSKSEGQIPLNEFGEDRPELGQVFDVYFEGQDADDMAVISKRRADRLRAWEEVSQKYGEGDIVQGVVQRKIKGGLLVDVEGVNVFLPASQVALRRTIEVDDLIDEPVRAVIIKVDMERMNIVVSRRKLMEDERAKLRKDLLLDIKEGQVRTGVVKNIAEFGVFVDLGGIDGLLHITDMSWGRVNHPGEMVKMDQELEVMVLKVDFERERIALGLKQKSASPWDGIEGRYPKGKALKGTVVNMMSYGAFVKLEEGIEGLVHISEMSWTKRINHPSELVSVGEEVEVVVLEINNEKMEVSLGMKQADSNPWDVVDDHYPVGTVIEGRVRNLTSYGAFVEIEEGIDGLLHVSDMSWTKKVAHPSELIKKGDTLQCVVLAVDKEKKRIALGRKQLLADPWLEEIPNNYHVGDLLTGFVTKITTFGAFVKLDDHLEGLLHISEITEDRAARPEDVVQAGLKVEVRVIRVDIEDRKIGLTLVHDNFPENEALRAAAAEKAIKDAARAEKKAEMEGEQNAESEGAEAKAEAPAAEAEAPAAEAEAPAAEAEAPAAEAEAPAAEAEAPAAEAEAPAAEPEAPAA